MRIKIKKSLQKLSDLERGFSLVELITIIAIIGILSYMALAKFSESNATIKGRTLARKIVSDVRYAQELALSHRQLVKCFIEPAQNRYTLLWGDDSYVQTPMAEKNFIVDFDGSDFDGINLTTTGFSSGLLSFNSKGQPLNNGSLMATELVLMVLNSTITIKVVPGTGRCYIQD